MEGQNSELQNKIAALTADITNLHNQLEEKDGVIAKLELDVEALEQKYNDALAANEALTETIEHSPAPVAEEKPAAHFTTLSFDYKGSKKGFRFPAVTFNGKHITAEEISVDEKLQEALIAQGSGMIIDK